MVSWSWASSTRLSVTTTTESKIGVLPLVEERGQPIRDPGDAVGLTRSGGVLDQVILSCPILLHIGDELAHRVELMVSGEDDPLLGHRLLVAVLIEDNVVFLLQVQEFVDDVDEAVLLQNGLPEVLHGIPIFASWVPLFAVETRTVGALVYGQEVGRVALEFGCHRCIACVYREKGDHAVLELEARFSGIATLPLSLGVLIGLIRELIFELYAHNGNAIEVEDYVDGLVPRGREVELPDAAACVLPISNNGSLI